MGQYLQPAEILNFYDAGRVAQIFTDTRVAADVTALSSNNLLIQCIYRAEAAINLAMEQGQRYSPTDMANIVAAANAVGAQEADILRAMPIKELTAHIAYGYGMARRGGPAESWASLAPMYDKALVDLQALADGRTVLDWGPNLAAGNPSIGVLGSQYGGIVTQNKLFAWTVNGNQYPGLLDSNGNYFG